MKLTLVRHGECTLSGTYCGHLDAPLTKKGREQAQDVAQRLGSVSFEICYRSPLSRTHETAQVICAHRDFPLVDSPLIKEMNFGRWEGKTYEELSKEFPDLMKKWISDPPAVSPPGGEPFSSLNTRVRDFLFHLIGKNHEDVLIVSHGGVIAALLLEIYKKPFSEFFQSVPPLGSFQTVEWSGDVSLIGAVR